MQVLSAFSPHSVSTMAAVIAASRRKKKQRGTRGDVLRRQFSDPSVGLRGGGKARDAYRVELQKTQNGGQGKARAPTRVRQGRERTIMTNLGRRLNLSLGQGQGVAALPPQVGARGRTPTRAPGAADGGADGDACRVRARTWYALHPIDALTQLSSATTEDEMLQAFTCILVCQRREETGIETETDMQRDLESQRATERVTGDIIVLGRSQL